MKLRVISLLLAIAIVILLIPTPASAVTSTATELETQIKNTYRSAIRYSGRWSFNGYCGSLVNWQTYLLGIDTQKYGCNGKDEYDLYSNLGTTTGGYRVKCYPASQYDLRAALNSITRNGAVDAYNILVGFQKTNTSEGSIYGHAVFVHGIVDGTVYFVECYSTTLDGRYWAEGEPIHCSIDTFCNYYASWTVFDGVAYFGLKTYADACREYPANMYAVAVENEPAYAEPADPGIYEGTLSEQSVIAGELVKITALLETPGGKFWYQIDRNGAPEYIAAGKLFRVADCYDDVVLTDQRMPTLIRKGNGFVLRGTVSSLSTLIQNVKVSVYDISQITAESVMEGQLEVDGKSIGLDTWRLDRYMLFRQLNAGVYRIEVTADVQTYLLKDGVPAVESSNVTVWNSEFRVVTDWKNYATITFDGNGGESAISQTAVVYGGTLGELPTAYRAGYTFAGWTMDREGNQPVTEAYSISGNTTLYAQWINESEGLSGWQKVDGVLCYYLNGIPVSNVTSPVDSDRNVIENWQTPAGALLAAGTALYETTPCFIALETRSTVPVENLAKS